MRPIAGDREHASRHADRKEVFAEQGRRRPRLEFGSADIEPVSAQQVVLAPDVRYGADIGIGDHDRRTMYVSGAALLTPILGFGHVGRKLHDRIIPQRDPPQVVAIHNVIGAILAPSAEEIAPRQNDGTCAKGLIRFIVLDDVLGGEPAYQAKITRGAVITEFEDALPEEWAAF